MTILEKRKLAPERDEHLKKGEFTVLNGEYSKNFNVYVVGEKHKEAVDFIKVALDRSTDNVLGFGIKMGCQKNFNVIVWDEHSKFNGITISSSATEELVSLAKSY